VNFMRQAMFAATMTAIIVISVIVLLGRPTGADPLPELDLDIFPEHKVMDETEAGYFQVKDIETDEVILRTARQLHVDDEYISQDNIHFHIEEVDDDTAWARSLGEVELRTPSRPDSSPQSRILEAVTGMFTAQDSPDDIEHPVVVGIYHSHGAEAYAPSDGDEFIDEGGGILQVGEKFSDALSAEGLDVIHITDTHVPHDAGAYNRSRRTVEELLKEDVDVLLDLHRDAVPREEYKEDVNGEEDTVQIQLVVGRQNQNAETIRSFAEEIKATVDENHSGLIKGILMASGNYNQDMSPRALLLEVGTHETTREGAEESAEMMASSVAGHLKAGAGMANGERGTVTRSILWIVLLTVVGLGAYLLISTGGTAELKAKLRRFFGEEFADVTRRSDDVDS